MKKVVVLTGAGISAESGLKTFRDSNGLWEGYNVYQVATPEGWDENPGLVLQFYNERRRDVARATPNAAHIALAKLEQRFAVTIVTQNVDDLHERAGSTKVVHLHGEIFKARSSVDPQLIYQLKEDIRLGDLCSKGSQLRPHIVWFGEAVPMMDEAIKAASEADVFVIVGSSLQVYPAAGLIDCVRSSVPKYLIDPRIPSLPEIPNLKTIAKRASEGVSSLVEELLGVS